jgi:hypothetical protein
MVAQYYNSFISSALPSNNLTTQIELTNLLIHFGIATGKLRFLLWSIIILLSINKTSPTTLNTTSQATDLTVEALRKLLQYSDRHKITLEPKYLIQNLNLIKQPSSTTTTTTGVPQQASSSPSSTSSSSSSVTTAQPEKTTVASSITDRPATDGKYVFILNEGIVNVYGSGNGGTMAGRFIRELDLNPKKKKDEEKNQIKKSDKEKERSEEEQVKEKIEKEKVEKEKKEDEVKNKEKEKEDKAGRPCLNILCLEYPLRTLLVVHRESTVKKKKEVIFYFILPFLFFILFYFFVGSKRKNNGCNSTYSG